MEQQSDLTLAELQVHLLEQRQLEVSIGRLCAALRDLGLRLKKSRAEQDTEAGHLRRAEWCASSQKIAAADLIFLDESGVTTAMTRRRWGRSQRGQRVPRCRTCGTLANPDASGITENRPMKIT